jgi:hypothetical protein
MFIFRALAYLFIMAGIGVGLYDLFNYLNSETAEGFAFTPVGKLWFELHANSLQLLEPAIVRVENLNAPLFWEVFVQPWVLEKPAAIVFAVFGIVLLVLIRLLRALFGRRRRLRQRRDSDLISN